MNILFYGDSNTWGFQGNQPQVRLAYEKRFTGIIAKRFPQHHIIEEGLPGRTICIDDPLDRGRNGMETLPMLLQTHEPLDLVVIMLGTNDTKIMFGHTPMTMRLAMERMIRLVQNTDAWSDTGVRPQILLVAPPRMGDVERGTFYGMFDAHSAEMIPEVSNQFRQLAQQYHCLFADGSQVAAQHCCDFIHLTAAEHAQLAQLIGDVIEQRFGQ